MKTNDTFYNNEIWKDIKGYEGYYQISSFGRVRGLPYMFSHMVRAFLNWRVDQTEHYSPALTKGMINIAVNEGKRFEQNWKNSCEKYPNIWIYRLKDNAASFGGGSRC